MNRMTHGPRRPEARPLHTAEKAAAGTAEVDGTELPVGLQIVGRPLDEAAVLRVAHAFEQS